MVQLSHMYMTTGRIIDLTIQTLVGKAMSLLFNMMTRLVMAFLPRGSESEILVAMSDSLQPHVDCTIHGVLQARILEWVAFPFSREKGKSQTRDQTPVSCTAGRFFTS